MKSVNETLLERRSIRRYERESVTPSQIEFIYQAIRNTPTSYNGQQFSVIDVSDQETKVRLAEVINQKQVKTCSHFLVFCADYHKIMLGAKAKGVEMPRFYDTLDGVIVGTVDASLAMMSAIVAAESMGLGTCPIGYARTVDPERISGILNLPPHVAVICGLAIGVPREINDIKPKQPTSVMIHHDRYRTDEDMTTEILDYDKLISEYNATRTGTTSNNDWITHIIGYYSEAMHHPMLKDFAKLGFDISQ